MRNGKIYKITNIKTEKKYIGCTVNKLSRRFKEHCYRCFTKELNTKLCNNLRKYGVENFKIELIETCSLEKIYEREVELIKEYNTYKAGLNSTLGGEGCLGYKHSEEYKISLSEKLKKYNRLKGKTYEDIYKDKATVQKIKIKNSVKKHWREMTVEDREKRINNVTITQRRNSKYSIETVNGIKKLLKDNLKPKEIKKIYPEVNIHLIYDIKKGKRWKD